MRLIDADAIKYRPIPHVALFGNVKTKQDTVTRGEIDSMPTVEAEPVRHGKWIDTNGATVSPFYERYKCSVCGGRSDNTNFCPNCGAKMDERKEE